MLKLEDILGVYILDDTRLPEGDLSLFLQQVTSLHLYLDEKKRPCYRYHFYTLENRREINIYEEGFIALLANSLVLSFAIVEKYESQIYLDAGDGGHDYKQYHHYQPPRMDTLPIHTDKGIYLENKGHFYIAIPGDIYGREAEKIALALLITGQRYRDNWEALVRP